MKKWLIDRFLPMWAKETVLADNRQLKRELRRAEREIESMKMYIQGLETGIRSAKRITIQTGGTK